VDLAHVVEADQRHEPAVAKERRAGRGTIALAAHFLLQRPGIGRKFLDVGVDDGLPAPKLQQGQGNETDRHAGKIRQASHHTIRAPFV